MSYISDPNSKFNNVYVSTRSYKPLKPLEYLAQKELIEKYVDGEELIFYPELYGLCPRFKHKDCLNLRKNEILLERVERYIRRTTKPNKRTPIIKYIYEYNFVEVYLDHMHLKDGVPKEVFHCKNLRILSLNGNGLRILSPDIGRLKKLQILRLTDNFLKTDSLPYTLTFCNNLHTLYLDNNKIIALPGFLLKMNSLQTIRRLSSSNTLRNVLNMNMLHRNLKHCRIEKIRHSVFEEIEKNSRYPNNSVLSLEKLAARIIIVSKIDYFSIEGCPYILQEVIRNNYYENLICENCTTPSLNNAGYKVSTYRYGHLGNYWSVFVHQACNKICANDLDELSYRMEKHSLAEVNGKYNEYVKSFEDTSQNNKSKFCCFIS